MKKTLAELRKEKQITQQKLASDLNIGTSTIALYENGMRTPSLKNAKLLAAYFLCSVEEIEFGKRDD